MSNRAYEVYDKEGKEEEVWIKFRRFAISYKKAFQTLIKKERLDASAGCNYDDEDILPALNLLHHYIELSLKSLLKRVGKSHNHHILKDLLIDVKKEYPNFKLSQMSESLMINEKSIKSEPFLDFEGFRYPIKKDNKTIWVSKGNLMPFINLVGVYIYSNRIISEIEDYFNKGVLKLPLKPFYSSNKID